MKVETYRALNAYFEKFGKTYEYNPKIKHSEEPTLVAEIEKALAEAPRRRRSASMMVKVQD